MVTSGQLDSMVNLGCSAAICVTMKYCEVFALLIATCGAFVARAPLPAIAPRRCAARAAPTAAADVAVVLLAGGVGSRMKADRPKQRVARRPLLSTPR